MISVLIPVYQEDISSLISSLIKAFKRADQPGEIVISDVSPVPLDAKSLDWMNNPLVSYHHHKIIKSRSENRNFLASKAKFDYLLFMDCDAIIPDPDFLVRYLEMLDVSHVICGGTIYQDTKPENRELVLRWKYGWKREVSTAANREIQPYNSFSSFNFCVPKTVFEKIGFNESFTQYGHEDTFFGYELCKHGISIKHVDNPLIHNGLEASEVFLDKTNISISSLSFLSKNTDLDHEFLNNVKLWRTYLKIKRSGLGVLLNLSYPFLSKLCLASLKSNNPSILLFDLYKLIYLVKIQG